MKKLFVVSIVALFIGAASVMADVPHMINHQGFLANTEGEPLDTTVAMTFAFYDAATNGTTLWSESQTSVTVQEGLFNVLLGSVNEIPDSVFADTVVWMGFTVGDNSEMTPRKRIVSVGYAYRVGTVDGANGGTITGKMNMGNGNTNVGDYAFVSGRNNHASGNYSVVAGGGYYNPAYGNSASGDYSTVSGGRTNTANGEHSTVAGGVWNNADNGYATISGGSFNVASALWSTVGGGNYNEATGYLATVGGGRYNKASNEDATVSGGYHNEATGYAATVCGGYYNRARGAYSVVGGGGDSNMADSNSAVGNWSVVCGGMRNYARGLFSFVGGGGGWSVSDSNSAIGEYSCISGGRGNHAIADYATISGGTNNEATGTYSTIGGGDDNQAEAGNATVSGGNQNLATGNCSTVSGGVLNQAIGQYSIVGGGWGNIAIGDYSTIGGGEDNQAPGQHATVAGGRLNEANGLYSFAVGYRAKANHDGCFVWGDGTNADITTTNVNQIRMRGAGGTIIYSNTVLTSGVTLAAGANAWTAVSDSIKKRNIRLVDTEEVLEKVAQLPIKQWSYKSQNPSIEHIGPMAQDFWKLFHLGEDSLGISTIDPDGIALAAIQELQKRNALLEKRVSQLECQVRQLANQKSGSSEQASMIDKNQ